ncbi:MAG: chorismate-binding protein [Cyanobacteriota bacterium SKYGB_h_bin112]|nr:chorismate-binding protein [Cyanobacteriota bacterium SKYGB_h_bin112]
MEIVQQDGQLYVMAQGEIATLQSFGTTSESLGGLLSRVDRWLDDCQLSAAGIMGFESSAVLSQPVRWLAGHGELVECWSGRQILVALQAGKTENLSRDCLTKPAVSRHSSRNRLLVDDALVDRVARLVAQGLDLRRQLADDHLVIAAVIPVVMRASLLDAWLRGLNSRFTRGFFMETDRWELASCTPERFVAMRDCQLEVQLLAGTFREGTTLLEKNRLISEHQAARRALRNLVERVCLQEDGMFGGINLTIDCDVVGFGAIKHFRSAFTTCYVNNTSLLRRLAALTPSPATGSQHSHVQAAIRGLEGQPRGYYGGCFFLRTPGCLETLISIRSIFRMRDQDIAELVAGAGFTASSTVEGETAEIIVKAMNCARLLGCEIRRVATHSLEKALVSAP